MPLEESVAHHTPEIATGPSPAVSYFGPFSLHRAERLLLLRGVPVSLARDDFELLSTLVDQARLPLAEAALAAGNPRTARTAAQLRRQVTTLNRVLERGSERHCIARLPGRGYCFFGETTHTATSRAAAASPAIRVSLPAARQPLVGRDGALHSLAERTQRERLLTIAGSGGIGKTSLALAVAQRCHDDYRKDACFVDLSSLTRPEQMVGAVAAAVGAELGHDDREASLLEFLKAQRLLIVLDNCEHLLAAAALLAERLLQAPYVHVLATSREPLRARGECVHHLDAMRVPPADARLDWNAAKAYSAVELFVLCAARSGCELEADSSAVHGVSSICRQLDGVPLAIELAAAQLPALGLNTLLAQLRQTFLGMAQDSTHVPARQSTLQATMDWSYSLLDDSGRAALRRLAVFRGEFPLDSALHVTADRSEDRDSALDALLGLAAKSLVAVEAIQGTVRYRLLESTRAYALAKLAIDADHDAARRRHIEDCRRRLALAEGDWARVPSRQWIAVHGRLLDELRFGLDWALSPNADQILGTRLLLDSLPMAARMALVYEFLERIKQALARIQLTGSADRMLEFQLCAAMGGWMMNMSQTDRAMREFNAQVQSMTRRLADDRCAPAAWSASWMSSVTSGDYPRARYAAERQLQWAEAHGDPVDVIDAKRQCAYALHFSGEHARAAGLARDVLAQAQPNSRVIYYSVNQIDHRVAMRVVLSRIQWLEGHADQATETIALALRFAENDRPTAKCQALAFAACPIALWKGDLPAAAEWVRQLDIQAGAHGLPLFQEWAGHFAGVLRARGHSVSVSCAEAPGEPSTMQSDVLATFGGDWPVAAALQRVQRKQVGWCAPELLRREGEMLVSEGRPLDEAKLCFVRAQDAARAHGTLAWALRAGISLARLHRDLGQPQQARVALAPVFGRFTEGHDTADLQDARALLDALS